MIGYKPILLSGFLFVCLAAAQQQQQQQQQQELHQSGVLAEVVCNVTTSKPAPTTKTYVVQPCIVAKFAGYISLGQGKYIQLNDGAVNDTTSNCKVNEQRLVVTFPCGELDFLMARINNSQILVRTIKGYYKTLNQLYNISMSEPMFNTPEDHYYKCNAEQSVSVGADTNLVLSNLAFEAFRNLSGSDFYKVPEECALDAGQVSDLVRIGVGICLVALVVIVLIAYFVGRRRWSERSSYESV